MELKLLATGINADTEHVSCIYRSCSFQLMHIVINFILFYTSIKKNVLWYATDTAVIPHSFRKTRVIYLR